jgi:long-chain acyl-CoA synthetase
LLSKEADGLSEFLADLQYRILKWIAPGERDQGSFYEGKSKLAVLLGEKRRFVSALIVPDFHQLKRWADDHGIEFDPTEEVAGSDWVRDLIREQVESRNRELAGFEKIKKFQILPDAFNEVGGEMTPTLKLKRRFIAEKYQDLIEEMYKE